LPFLRRGIVNKPQATMRAKNLPIELSECEDVVAA
jgi:hypothetical protein